LLFFPSPPPFSPLLLFLPFTFIVQKKYAEFLLSEINTYRVQARERHVIAEKKKLFPFSFFPFFLCSLMRVSLPYRKEKIFGTASRMLVFFGDDGGGGAHLLLSLAAEQSKSASFFHPSPPSPSLEPRLFPLIRRRRRRRSEISLPKREEEREGKEKKERAALKAVAKENQRHIFCTFPFRRPAISGGRKKRKKRRRRRKVGRHTRAGARENRGRGNILRRMWQNSR
jgi:hypothetical protein